MELLIFTLFIVVIYIIIFFISPKFVFKEDKVIIELWKNNKEKRELEEIIKANNGIISIDYLSEKSTLSYDKAEKFLKWSVKKRDAIIRISKEGETLYIFTEFDSSEQT